MRLALVICVALCGCADHEAVQLERIKRQVCACQNVKCAEIAMQALPHTDVVASHKSQGSAREMLDCLAKLYAAERPSTDPDAGSATAAAP